VLAAAEGAVSGARGTVTFFFSDIEGSTRLLKALRDDYPRLLAAHRELVRSAFSEHGGQEVDTQGDAFFAAFPNARDAVLCALAVRRAHETHAWPQEKRVRVRVGIHTGYALVDEGRYSGLAVHRAARISAVAEGGQILVSQATQAILEDEEEQLGFRLVDLGERQLKDLDRPARLFEVVDDRPQPSMATPAAPEDEDQQIPLPAELAHTKTLPLVSRSAELAAAEALIDDRERERLGIVWLFGEPGIGKTRLAIELGRRAHEAGDTVLFGRCSEDLPVAYEPFLEGLHHFITYLSDRSLAARLGSAARELVRLAPELGEKISGLQPIAVSHPDIEQYRLFDSIRSWLTHAAGEHKLVMIIDDLHWATEATLALISHLARSPEPSKVALVCTAWGEASDQGERLAAMIQSLRRHDVPMVELELSGLGVDDIGELISLAAWRNLDTRLDRLARELQRETAGNPLFVEALLAGFDEQSRWALGEPPDSIAATVHTRVARLAPDVLGILRMASVAGLTFDVRVLARACERDELSTLDALEVAARAALVQEGSANEYSFTHAVVRSVMQAEISESRRVRMHLRIAEALEAVHGTQLTPSAAAALAHHFYQALPTGEVEKPFRYSLLAAAKASWLLSHREAVEAYRQALSLIDRVEAPAVSRTELLLSLGEAEYRAGSFQSARETLRTAAATALEEGSAERLARSAILHEAATTESGATANDSVDLLTTSTAALPDEDSALRAITLASLGRALEFCGRHTESMERCDRALEMARRLDDQPTTAAVIVRTAFAYLRLEYVDLVAARSAELLKLAHETRNDETLAWAMMFGVWASLAGGDGARADAQLEQLLSLVDKLRQPWWHYTVTQMRFVRALTLADLGSARQLLERSRELGDDFGNEYEGGYGLGMFLVQREAAKLQTLAPTLRTLVRLNPSGSLWAPGLAAMCAELDMFDEAQTQLRTLTADGLYLLPTDGTRPLCVALLAEVCSRLKDTQAAGPLFAELLPSQGKVLVVWGTLACLGPVDRLLGMLAPLVGRPEDAEHWFEAALVVSAQLDSPLWRARTLLDFGQHLRPTDLSRSTQLLEQAYELAQQHGLTDIADKASACLSGGDQ
jgi:class 3 adenylate cyclase/tetratricopeptide (TPR) repeat protein